MKVTRSPAGDSSPLCGGYKHLKTWFMLIATVVAVGTNNPKSCI